MKLTKREQIAVKLSQAIVSTLDGWDLMSTGDFSPEEDTTGKEIADKAVSITDALLARLQREA